MNTHLWLCATKAVINPLNDGDELYEIVHEAMYAIQLICPSGCKNIYLKFEQTAKGYVCIGCNQYREMGSTLLGRVTYVEQQGLARDFDRVYEGIQRAFKDNVVRICNPIRLLEHAMQVGEVYLGTLMTAMGLDMLFMAGEMKTFVPRVSGFLGPHSLVFPRESIVGQQPIVEVGDVVGNLYEFRNFMAHGRAIPKSPYHEKYRLLGDNGTAINHFDYYYVQLLHEAGLFMLATALKRILNEGWFDAVKTEKEWKRQMTVCEHRYKNQLAIGRPEAVQLVLNVLNKMPSRGWKA